VSEFFSVAASIYEDRHQLSFYKFLILSGWSGQAQRLLNQHSLIIGKSSGWSLRDELSHLLHIRQLKFGVVVQKDPAKIKTSA
jgi:hypothetical protein